MVSVNDLKTGLTVKTSDGSIWQVIEFQHVKPERRCLRSDEDA